MRIKRAAIVAAVSSFALAGLAQADVVDFNTPGDLSKFTINNQTGVGGYSQVTTGGVGGSGAVMSPAGLPARSMRRASITSGASIRPKEPSRLVNLQK
jgi:hypothetical protein